MARVTVNGNIDFRKANNRFFTGVTIKNGTGAEVTLDEASLLLFDETDGKFYAYPEDSVLKPVAIVPYDMTIGATSEITGSVCVWGDVNASALSLPGSDTIDTVPTSNGGTAMAITAGGSNVGNGVAGAITQGSLAKAGTYTLTCTAEASNAGTFQVVDPDGFLMAPLTVAVAYDNGAFGVTIADGAEDFDIGDVFTVVGDVEASGSIRLMLKETGIIAEEVVQIVE